MNRRYVINERLISENNFISIVNIGFARAIRNKHRLFKVFYSNTMNQKINLNLN